jgi:hypothetical protein
MKNKKTSLCIALIHNNNLLRNSYIKPQLENLTRVLQSKFTVSEFDVSYQGEINPHRASMAFIRDIIYQNLASKWRKYRLLKSREFFNWIIFLRTSFVKYILNPNCLLNQLKRTSSIEMMVTDKHLRAWGRFVDSGADYLMVFEDDAVFKEDSAVRIKELINKLSKKQVDKPCYVDIGGGFELADLMICQLEISQVESYRYYGKPVTNTVCAYLMCRQLASILYTKITKRPWLRMMNSDWLLNSLFINIQEDGVKCLCMHSDPTIVKHGTFAGDYSSSIR